MKIKKIEQNPNLCNFYHRKVFEPQYYKDSLLLEIFDKYFGTFESRNPSEVCVVGFEPNIRKGLKIDLKSFME